MLKGCKSRQHINAICRASTDCFSLPLLPNDVMDGAGEKIAEMSFCCFEFEHVSSQLVLTIGLSKKNIRNFVLREKIERYSDMYSQSLSKN